MQASRSNNDQTARISLQISRNVKKQRKQNNPTRAIFSSGAAQAIKLPDFTRQTTIKAIRPNRSSTLPAR
jgi:hypothetical protein